MVMYVSNLTLRVSKLKSVMEPTRTIKKEDAVWSGGGDSGTLRLGDMGGLWFSIDSQSSITLLGKQKHL